jgi:beta-galactosidase
VGIRTISVDAERGFLLNGQPIKLRGGCVHHDNGCLGACAYDRAEERRVALLKASGFNAIRTSHNPPSPAFLDACDRLGVLVLDEAFDCWKHGKTGDDYARYFEPWWQRDIDSMVLRDRNHPSVVLWSIGNEIPGQSTVEGGETGAKLAARVRELDPTRPVTQAANPDDTTHMPIYANLDVCGYNYMSANYVRDHGLFPRRVMAGTESQPMACFDQWMAVLDHPYVIGDFVWTALDYLGEAGVGKTAPQSTPPGYVDNRLWTVSNCGDLDLCGFKRPPCYCREAVWGRPGAIACFAEALGPDGKPESVQGWGWPDERPSWTWPGREGKPIKVRAYASAAQVRLLLNGKDLGVKPTGRDHHFTAEWEVPYAPGELVALGLDKEGKEISRWTLRTAAAPAALRLTPDRTQLAADGQDLSFVTVEVLDARGVPNPNAASLLHFAVEGPGRIVGVGNGDPRSVESFQQPERRAYRGRCLVVVKAGEQGGSVRLKATADGLQGGEAALQVGPR